MCSGVASSQKSSLRSLRGTAPSPDSDLATATLTNAVITIIQVRDKWPYLAPKLCTERTRERVDEKTHKTHSINISTHEVQRNKQQSGYIKETISDATTRRDAT